VALLRGKTNCSMTEIKFKVKFYFKN
jgi:hypothetical protein